MINDRDPVTSQEEFAQTQPLPDDRNDVDKVAATQPVAQQNDVDKIAASMGVEKPEEEPLKMRQKLERRDEDRYMLDPDSAEDH